MVRSKDVTWCLKCGLYFGMHSHFENISKEVSCDEFLKAKGTHEWEANGKTGHRTTWTLVGKVEIEVRWIWIGYSCTKCGSSGYLDTLKHEGRLILHVMTMDLSDSCSVIRMRRALK